RAKRPAGRPLPTADAGAVLRRAGARRGGQRVPVGGGVEPGVGVHDVAHEPVPDDVRTGQVREVDVVDPVEDVAHHLQPGTGHAGQVNLRHVACNVDLLPEPVTRQE